MDNGTSSSDERHLGRDYLSPSPAEANQAKGAHAQEGEAAGLGSWSVGNVAAPDAVAAGRLGTITSAGRGSAREIHFTSVRKARWQAEKARQCSILGVQKGRKDDLERATA